MRTARPLGLTGDGKYLMVATDDGLEIAIPADDRLRAALRADSARLGQLEIEMDSALRPRDIQARIRAGESPEDVARAAGVPVERIDAFAAPVIAERDHVAGLAQMHPVRRRGETTSHRNLRNAVADALAGRGIDVDSATWDAWKVEDRRWRVALRYRSGSADHEAHFLYDQGGRFTVADSEEARWMIGEDSSAHGPQPGRRRPQRTPAPGLVDDELAIVRAISQPEPPPTPEVEPEDALDAEVLDVAASAAKAQGDGDDAGDGAEAEVLGVAVRVPEAAADDTEDAYHPGELAEVDGVIEIVPVQGSDMDVLHDMLSSFDEDSVRIYAGLMRPDEGTDAPVVPATPPVAEQVDESLEDTIAVPPAVGDTPDGASATEPAPVPSAPSVRAAQAAPAEAAQDEDESAACGDEASDAEPAASGETAAASPQGPPEPEQLSLIDDVESPEAEQAARPRRTRKRRAQVPSWDEIMFGGPREGE